MPNVIDLEINAQSEPRKSSGTAFVAVRFNGCPATWREAIMAVIARPTLEKLVIGNLILPADILASATGLRDLAFVGCWLGTDRWHCFQAKRRWRDIASKSEPSVILKKDRLRFTLVGGKQFVEQLTLRVEVMSGFEHAEQLFIRTKSLRELRLHIEVFVDDNLLAFPLARLNEGSFLCLTNVILHLSIDFEIAHSRLERLDVNLKLCHVTDDDFDAIEPGLWARLGEVLAPLIPGSDTPYLAFDKVREVTVRVQVSPAVNFTMFIEECTQDARELCEYIELFVLPPAYARLVKLSKQGQLKFSFAAEVVDIM